MKIIKQDVVCCSGFLQHTTSNKVLSKQWFYLSIQYRGTRKGIYQKNRPSRVKNKIDVF
ncbi:MAG: hypothetical protein ABF272_00615 [Flavobacteriales bacterium]